MKGFAAFAIIEGIPGYDGLIPMIQEKDKPPPELWKLVGRTAENGETVFATVVREIEEEIGIAIHPISDDDIIYERELVGKGGVPYDFFIVKGRYCSGEIKLGKEVKRIGFFTSEQIKEMIRSRETVKNHADALRVCL